MNKNDKIEVVIEDIGANLEGICHVDGITVFVPFALPGEKCLIHILKVKDNIAFAKLDALLESSGKREQPVCPYYKKCGGCVFQHANRLYETKVKSNMIKSCFSKYAGLKNLSVDVVDSAFEYGYRNKCAFPIRETRDGVGVCMFKSNSHDAVLVEKCALAEDLINKVVKTVNDWIKKYNVSAYNDELKSGELKYLVCRVLEGVALITLVSTTRKLKYLNELCDMLKTEGVVFGLNININKLNNNVILTEKFVNVYGITNLESNENGIRYPVSSLSFMQINNDIKTKIYNKVLNSIESGHVIIDAYSGAGLMSAMLAQKAKHVYGIEIIEAATKNADKLKEINNIKNLININGDCSKELTKITSILKDEEVEVVLDPPRKGCSTEVLNAIIKSTASKVIYVSCNPATLARDAKILLDNEFVLDEIKGYNMFPKTAHVETVAIFSRRCNHEN